MNTQSKNKNGSKNDNMSCQERVDLARENISKILVTAKNHARIDMQLTEETFSLLTAKVS